MKVLIVLAVISVVIALYVVWLRPWMRNTTWGKALLDKVEPFERILYWKSESMLWARFKMAMGAVLTFIVGIDWNSVAPILPEKYRGLAAALPTILLAIDGLIGERLRRDTTKPLEIVAMRTDAPAEVKQAAVQAAVANKEAVVTIEASEAKAA